MTPLDRDRLAKVLAMLASPHPGEVAAAAKKALILLNAAETTWKEVLDTPASDDQAEELQAKINALKASNSRLRVENHTLRAPVKQAGPQSVLVRVLSVWIMIVFALGLLIFIAFR